MKMYGNSEGEWKSGTTLRESQLSASLFSGVYCMTTLNFFILIFSIFHFNLISRNIMKFS